MIPYASFVIAYASALAPMRFAFGCAFSIIAANVMDDPLSVMYIQACLLLSSAIEAPNFPKFAVVSPPVDF